MKVLVTAGAIPARLDSVKFITNRFKGGLALNTAERLSKAGHDVTIVAWKYAGLKTDLPVILIDDVSDYYKKVLAFEADAYVLAAAVANLMPSNPWPGKFPSHDYKVGDRFPIEFEIAPRIIDELKKKYPRCTLIGYKLFDGTDEEIIRAATLTLHESKANLVFANHPAWAKTRKLALTQDGSIVPCTFDEHCEMMDRLLKEQFYSTGIEKTDPWDKMTEEDRFVITSYPKYQKDGRIYGTFAIRKKDCFITTQRGKVTSAVTPDNVTFVFDVDHVNRRIIAHDRATLNAPLLDALFKCNPHINILIHGHELIGEKVHNQYEFPGTAGDCSFAVPLMSGWPILLNHHGYIIGFTSFSDYQKWVSQR